MRPTPRDSNGLRQEMTKPKILLVDDEVGVRNVFQIYLETQGCVVASASSIAEALHLIRRDDFTLIIIDIFLHEESGLDLLRGVVAARPTFR
jgi:DNA-binding NtrC family response regulator